jgi:hypothetical protein
VGGDAADVTVVAWAGATIAGTTSVTRKAATTAEVANQIRAFRFIVVPYQRAKPVRYENVEIGR